MTPAKCQEKKRPRYKQDGDNDFCIIDIRGGKALFTNCFEVSEKICKKMRATITSVDRKGGRQ